MTATSYISEIAPTRARGAALGFYQLFVSTMLIKVEQCADRTVGHRIFCGSYRSTGRL
jgi:hypothetical protein